MVVEVKRPAPSFVVFLRDPHDKVRSSAGGWNLLPSQMSGLRLRSSPPVGRSALQVAALVRESALESLRRELEEMDKAEINFDAVATVRKWPSLGNARRGDREPYFVHENTLKQCLSFVMAKPLHASLQVSLGN